MADILDISPTTGKAFYSGSYKMISNLCRSLNIANGKMSNVSADRINFFQELVDREIDAILNSYYIVPLVEFNQKQPSGTTVLTFPGNIRTLSMQWAAGKLLVAEFQQLEPNVSDIGARYVNEARTQLYEIIRYNERIPGQIYKSGLRTMPPTMQPTVPRELNVQ